MSANEMPSNPTSAPPIPDSVDVERPAAARVYDWYLGGAHNFESDRAFGKQMAEVLPMVKECALANRAFLRRAVAYLAGEAGIRQFIDIGSGVPTVGNVHEVAQRTDPAARTVYVDYEFVAVAHANLILDEQDQQRERTTVLQLDFRDPEAILNHPETRRLIDFSQPVALLAVALLPFIGPGDQPEALLTRYREALPSGSFLTMSQITAEGVPASMAPQVERFAASYADTPNPVYLRSHAEFGALFAGFDLLEPGVVWAPEWRPEGELRGDPSEAVFMTAVGRKP
jgi:hypothetical protein